MSSLSKINPNCAGIDIGNESIFIGIEEWEVASFGTFTDDYLGSHRIFLKNTRLPCCHGGYRCLLDYALRYARSCWHYRLPWSTGNK